MRKKYDKLKIGINASYLRKPYTGIGQVTLNFLKKLSKLKVESDPPARFAKALARRAGEAGKLKDIEFILYLEEEIPKDLKLPKNFTKKIFLPIYKRDDLIRKIWWEKFLLPRLVRKDGCDVFVSMYQCPTVIARESRDDRGNLVLNKFVLNIARLLRYARNDKNIKHIMIVHDIIPKLFPKYLDNARKKVYWKLTEYGIKKADKIIAVSKRTEKDLIEHLNIGADRITTEYIDVDECYKVETQNFASLRERNILKKYKLNSGYILAGGGYEVRKNVEGVVRAYKLLLERNKKENFLSDFPRLAIYGKVLPENLSLATPIEKILRELNLTKYVILLGEVPQKDLPALFSHAIMFAYPSFYEGFGMQILEAMSVGTPVVTSKVSSLPEVGGDSVLYCNPDDTIDIAMVLKNVLTNKDLREQLKSRGIERAKQFSWEKFTEKVLNIISSYESTK
ncbi:MAG: hypothetical protein A2271_00580 [Candidatus Moranbacteria bacterium RIFOXYA12_FULL_35_19]|nr:MAG: Glycosyl transferase group 1 [Candidatus Moranbacteria bacterium GW2011_GWF2_35_39]OGI32278.1 MAG: hypothetical protein A2489_02980 [Candidatus Moranbacteria bacterium RIFOXYC12_FULL_36_13]OGI33179.1 MAG: hypothetical protein A2343_00880 [Candidatus Moranbacteria bacterium RIFOXYB12_FULL_35_8]OGI35859.1 MAG: hypothetical protein A2271_00580 [Candidatus Moranbacteria bacterium RIFOXYA12_FULL_35_19]